MTFAAEAIYEQGTLKLTETLPLKEGMAVKTIVIACDESAGDTTLAEQLAAIASLLFNSSLDDDEASESERDRVLYPVSYRALKCWAGERAFIEQRIAQGLGDDSVTTAETNNGKTDPREALHER